MTAPKHRRCTRRPGSFARTALAVAVCAATAAGVFAAFIVDHPAPAEAATVVLGAPIAPEPFAVRSPAPTAAPPTTVHPPSTTAPSSSAIPRKRTSSAPTTTRKRYTEDELRDRAKDITTDDLRAGRGSMPSGGLTSGEEQLVWACQQGYATPDECS